MSNHKVFARLETEPQREMMDIDKAARLDVPEGTVTITISATLYAKWLKASERLEWLESD